MATTAQPFQSGSPVTQGGEYIFARFVDGTPASMAPQAERHHQLAKGQTFPKVAGKDAIFELKRAL